MDVIGKRWSALMNSFLGAQDVLEMVQHGYEELGAESTYVQKVTFKGLKKKYCKVLFYIKKYGWSSFWIDFRGLKIKGSVRYPREVSWCWRKYEANETSFFKEEVWVDAYGRWSKISDYFSQCIVVVNHTKTCGETNANQQVVEKVMRCLTSRFDFILVEIKKR